MIPYGWHDRNQTEPGAKNPQSSSDPCDDIGMMVRGPESSPPPFPPWKFPNINLLNGLGAESAKCTAIPFADNQRLTRMDYFEPFSTGIMVPFEEIPLDMSGFAVSPVASVIFVFMTQFNKGAGRTPRLAKPNPTLIVFLFNGSVYCVFHSGYLPQKRAAFGAKRLSAAPLIHLRPIRLGLLALPELLR
ncbi:MAG: hypothetical protein JO110_14070 [Acetobacteraceae bacterium]|nr:hypothetical protein [Acetobacteraceae bacterium]